MKPFVKIKRFLFYASIFLIDTAAAQTNTTADKTTVLTLLNQSEELKKELLYDSSIKISNKAVSLSKQIAYRAGEVAAYDKIAEVLLIQSKMPALRQYDSLIIPIAQQLKDTTLLINAYNRTGVYYMENGKHKEAEQYFSTALNMGLNKQQSDKTAEVYSNLASLNLSLGEKDKAVDGFFKALRLYEKNGNETGQGETYSNISSVYYLMGKTDDAVEFQKKSITLRERQHDIPGLVITNTNIGQLYILKEMYPQALYHLKQAVAYASQVKNSKQLGTAYSGLSAYYSRTKNFDSALLWQTKAIQLFEETDNKPVLSRLYVAAGNLANVNRDSIKAVDFYTKGLQISTALNNKENIGNVHEKMSAFYLSHNDFAKAYDHYKKYISYKDSITAKSTLTKIEEIRTQYETEKKDNEIARLGIEQRIKQLEIEKQRAVIAGNKAEALQKQNEIGLLSKSKELLDIKLGQQEDALEKQLLISKNSQQQLQLAETERKLKEKQLENQKQLRNLMIGAALVTLLLGWFLFNRYQLKKKLEQQNSLLAMRNNISQDLHDDIGASLSNINILNELARRNIAQPQKSNEYLSKASEDIQRISESLSDIVWNINPRYDDLQNLFIKMKRYAADMLDGKNINGQFNFPANEVNLKLSMTQRRDLYLIFKEAINNLVKYSEAQNAAINVVATNQQIELLVKDDGKGFEREKVNAGNGLQNMQQRAAATGASFSISSTPGYGTTVQLKMKID